MYQAVGQRQIANSVVVLVAVEVVTIAAKGLAQSVAVVQHGRDAVEAEAVEVEFFQPVAAVGQQEVQHLVLAVVEAQRVPCRVLMAVTGIEELVGVSCQIAKALDLVFHGMRVYNIHDDGNAHFVGCVNHFLQFLRGSEATARCEK